MSNIKYVFLNDERLGVNHSFFFEGGVLREHDGPCFCYAESIDTCEKKGKENVNWIFFASDQRLTILGMHKRIKVIENSLNTLSEP